MVWGTFFYVCPFDRGGVGVLSFLGNAHLEPTYFKKGLHLGERTLPSGLFHYSRGLNVWGHILNVQSSFLGRHHNITHLYCVQRLPNNHRRSSTKTAGNEVDDEVGGHWSRRALLGVRWHCCWWWELHSAMGGGGHRSRVGLLLVGWHGDHCWWGELHCATRPQTWQLSHHSSSCENISDH